MDVGQIVGPLVFALALGGLVTFLVYEWRQADMARDRRRRMEVETRAIIVRTYRSQFAYQEDAHALAASGFRPTSVTEQRNSNTCLYVILILLFWLIVPLILLVLLVIVNPPGTRLVVTYQRAPARIADRGEGK